MLDDELVSTLAQKCLNVGPTFHKLVSFKTMLRFMVVVRDTLVNSGLLSTLQVIAEWCLQVIVDMIVAPQQQTGLVLWIVGDFFSSNALPAVDPVLGQCWFNPFTIKARFYVLNAMVFST